MIANITISVVNKSASVLMFLNYNVITFWN